MELSLRVLFAVPQRQFRPCPGERKKRPRSCGCDFRSSSPIRDLVRAREGSRRKPWSAGSGRADPGTPNDEPSPFHELKSVTVTPCDRSTPARPNPSDSPESQPDGRGRNGTKRNESRGSRYPGQSKPFAQVLLGGQVGLAQRLGAERVQVCARVRQGEPRREAACLISCPTGESRGGDRVPGQGQHTHREVDVRG